MSLWVQYSTQSQCIMRERIATTMLTGPQISTCTCSISISNIFFWSSEVRTLVAYFKPCDLIGYSPRLVVISLEVVTSDVWAIQRTVVRTGDKRPAQCQYIYDSLNQWIFIWGIICNFSPPAPTLCSNKTRNRIQDKMYFMKPQSLSLRHCSASVLASAAMAGLPFAFLGHSG